MSLLEDLEQQNEGTSLLSESKTQAKVADYHSHRVNDSIPADAHHREQHQQLVDNDPTWSTPSFYQISSQKVRMRHDVLRSIILLLQQR